ncbi:MAG: hypothetical protein V3S01_08665, partial [Dehalococcoidia bacterium]
MSRLHFFLGLAPLPAHMAAALALSLAFCVGFLQLGAAGSARAATLSYTGTLSVNVIPQQYYLGPLTAHATASGSGTAVVNGSATAIHLSSFALAGGTFGPITTSLFPITASPTIASIRFTSIENQAASFTAISGGPPGGGPMGLAGLAKICLVFGPCNLAGATVPLSPTAGGAGFGIGGTDSAPGAIAHTYQHAPWTIGQPVMTIHTPSSAVTCLLRMQARCLRYNRMPW